MEAAQEDPSPVAELGVDFDTVLLSRRNSLQSMVLAARDIYVEVLLLEVATLVQSSTENPRCRADESQAALIARHGEVASLVYVPEAFQCYGTRKYCSQEPAQCLCPDGRLDSFLDLLDSLSR